MLLKMNSIRDMNKVTILKYIIENQPLSRADISDSLGINKASVSEITRELIDGKLVNEVGTGSSSVQGGRKPILLCFSADSGVSIGVDLGVHSIRFIITNLLGKVLFKEKILYDHRNAYEIIKSFLLTHEKFYSKLPYGVVASTISVQGIVQNNKIFFTPYYNIVDVEKLSDCFDFPIYFENEANLAAYSHAFMNKNSSKNVHNVAAITLRSGIGSGVVHNETIYRGYESSAGGLGHTIVVPDGRVCSCGNRGCLEKYVSERAIIKEFNKLSGTTDQDLKDFLDGIDSNQKIATDFLKKASRFLGMGINNFIALFAIQEIYLVGNITEEIDYFASMTKGNIHNIFSRDISLINSPHGKFASSLGGCYLGINYFINNRFK